MSQILTKVDMVGDDLVVTSSQQCTPIAEFAKAMHNEGFHGSGEMKFAANIPDIFIEKYCQDNGITFGEWMSNQDHIRRMLNDPALAHFRIWKGKV